MALHYLVGAASGKRGDSLQVRASGAAVFHRYPVHTPCWQRGDGRGNAPFMRDGLLERRQSGPGRIEVHAKRAIAGNDIPNTRELLDMMMTVDVRGRGAVMLDERRHLALDLGSNLVKRQPAGEAHLVHHRHRRETAVLREARHGAQRTLVGERDVEADVGLTGHGPQ